MARTRRDKTQAAPPNAMVASAARLSGAPDMSKAARRGKGWQRLGWQFYDEVGEYRYSVDWVGALLSRARLFVVRRTEDSKTSVVTDGPAAQALSELFVDDDGRGEMLRLLGVHFTCPGEAYLVYYVKKGEPVWEIVASTEITTRGGRWYIDSKEITGEGGEKPLIIRLWRPHPQKPKEANSPTRAVLPILGELSGMTKMIAAQVDSRLAGAGVLFINADLEFSDGGKDGEATTSNVGKATAFSKALQEAMMAAIADREDAASLVPIIATVPGEQMENAAKHVTFWSDLDEHAKEMRDEAIRRLALGMDMPPEVLTGVAETNHWSAWQADESAIKAHTEPLLKIITTSLTTGYLRPAIEGEDGLEGEASEYSIAADTSALRLRPNRSKEAVELYDRGELDGDVLRRETGFGDDDALDAEQLARWISLQMIKGNTSATPEQVAWALSALLKIAGVPTSSEEEARGPRGTPSLVEHPTRDIPERNEAAVAAGMACVRRALERAGNRLKASKKITPPKGVAACDLYQYGGVNGNIEFLMEDAWSTAALSAADAGVEPEPFIAALDAYTRTILESGEKPDRARLARYLEAEHS